MLINLFPEMWLFVLVRWKLIRLGLYSGGSRILLPFGTHGYVSFNTIKLFKNWPDIQGVSHIQYHLHFALHPLLSRTMLSFQDVHLFILHLTNQASFLFIYLCYHTCCNLLRSILFSHRTVHSSPQGVYFFIHSFKHKQWLISP